MYYLKKLLKINCSYLCFERGYIDEKYANYINYFKGDKHYKRRYELYTGSKKYGKATI